MPQAPRNIRMPYWVAGACVLAVGVLVSVVLSTEQARQLAVVEQQRFDQHASEFRLVLRNRLANYTELVAGLRGLFVANPQLTRSQFNRVAAQLDPLSRNAGVVNLSFTRWVHGNGRAAFEAAQLQDPALAAANVAAFSVYPESTRSEFFVADYVWPLKENEQILGLDIGSQPVNLAAMERARSNRDIVASAPFMLVQKSLHQPGVVIRAPVFAGATPSATPLSADDLFLGAVAVTVNVFDLVRNIEVEGNVEGLRVHLKDIGAPDAPHRPPGASLVKLYESDGAQAVSALAPASFNISVHDRYWQLDIFPAARFLSEQEQGLPTQTAQLGACLSLLLAAVVMLLARQRRLALAQAQQADLARASSEERFRALFNQAAVGVALVEMATGTVTEANPRFAAIVKRAPASLRGRSLKGLFQAGFDAQRASDQLKELAGMRQGEFTQEVPLKMTLLLDPAAPAHAADAQRWVSSTISTMQIEGDAAPSQAIVVLHDITARRALEGSLRHNEARLRALLQRMPVGVMLMNTSGTTALCNQRFTDLTGYTERDVATADIWWEKAYPDAAYRERLVAQWTESIRLAISYGTTVEAAEYSVACADGRERPLEVAGVLVGEQVLITFVDLAQRKAAEQEIRTLAYYDLLTDLPNRRLLVDRLQEAVAHCRAPSHCAVMLLDVDNFKALNDTRGHERGDALLKLVGKRIAACVRTEDTVARLGGDEFALLLEAVGHSKESAHAHCEQIVEKIMKAVREPYLIEGEAHHNTLSIGIALFTSDDESADDLLQRVDLAMYQAKAAGRDTSCFYHSSMHAQASERAALEEDIRYGLAANQFDLYYQPQVDHGRIVAAEALLRWNHPQRGFVSPEQFIPLAEESGLILPLGQWVLEEACRTLARWADDPVLAELSVAVNVSPRQFRQAGFVPQVLATLASTGAAARRLKLEITEGLLLHDVDESAARMTELQGYGVGFSLDDFGTGYSSLSYLKRLPLDQIKIDQSFVRDLLTDPNDASIVRTIVALGASLGLQVLAEGVETDAQRQFLARHHCHAWQGYLLTKPVPAAEFEALVATHRAS